MNIKKIFITGAGGFIGNHLVNYLIDEGYQIIGIDLHGPDNLNYSKFYTVDLLSSQIDDLFKEHQPDFCIHAAGPASVQNSLMFLENDFKLTMLPTFNILKAIKNNCPKCRFIYLSSAAVYGNPIKLPIDEDQAIQPISPYGFHKMHAENICREFYSLYRIPIAVARIFSAYGNGLKKQLLWDICMKAKKSNVVELSGTGEETRDFINVIDLCEAIKLIIEKGPFDLDFYNVANGYQIKIKEVAAFLVSAFPNVSELRFTGEKRLGDPINWEADIMKIRKLGYKQKVDFKEGVLQYAEWFKRI